MSATFAAPTYARPSTASARSGPSRAPLGRRVSRIGLVAALTIALGNLMPGLVGQASAASVEHRALDIAASKRGDPYEWGASGPYAFDCSGLTYYAYRRAGYPLGRTAQEQYDQVRHIRRSERRPGDLVFFHNDEGYVYHVGVYAGGGRIWHAPHPGAVVRLERIWTRKVWYGRTG